MVRGGSRIEEDEVLSDRNRTLLLCSFPIAFFSAGFREARAASRNTRVLPAAPPLYSPFAHKRSGIGICSPACSVVTDRTFCLSICHSLIYIHIRVFYCLWLHSCLLCRRAVSLCVSLFIHMRLSLSLSFPRLSPALRSKTPVVPPRFPTHARSNATYLVNPT